MFIAICEGYSYRCFLLILRAVIGDTSSAMPLSEPFFEMLSASSSWLALLESSGAGCVAGGGFCALEEKSSYCASSQKSSVLSLASRRHNRARFGEPTQKSYLCTSRKRRGAGFSSFRVLRGVLSYKSAKTILYDRKNYKQARENLPLYSFPDVLESENSHAFRRIFLGANFLCLNYL